MWYTDMFCEREQYDNTEKMAEAIAECLRSEGCSVTIHNARAKGTRDLRWQHVRCHSGASGELAEGKRNIILQLAIAFIIACIAASSMISAPVAGVESEMDWKPRPMSNLPPQLQMVGST